MCPIRNVFRDKAISLHSSKIVDKKEILSAVSNTGIYCSSDKVSTLYLLQYIFKNPTVNICAPCKSSVQCTVYCIVKWLYLGPIYIYNFCLEWRILWPPRILIFPLGTPSRIPYFSLLWYWNKNYVCYSWCILLSVQMSFRNQPHIILINSVVLVRKRTTPTERPPILMPTFADKRCRVVSATDPHGRILGFLDRSRYYFFQVAPQLYSRGWVDPVPI
jgi:hypothetical protein